MNVNFLKVESRFFLKKISINTPDQLDRNQKNSKNDAI